VTAPTAAGAGWVAATVGETVAGRPDDLDVQAEAVATTATETMNAVGDAAPASIGYTQESRRRFPVIGPIREKTGGKPC